MLSLPFLHVLCVVFALSLRIFFAFSLRIFFAFSLRLGRPRLGEALGKLEMKNKPMLHAFCIFFALLFSCYLRCFRMFFAFFLHCLCVFFASGAPEARRGSGKAGSMFIAFLFNFLCASLSFSLRLLRVLCAGARLLRRSWACSRNKDKRRMQTSATPGRKKNAKQNAKPGREKHAKQTHSECKTAISRISSLWLSKILIIVQRPK